MSTTATDLIRSKGFIGGAWTPASNGSSFAVTDPASGTRIADVADMTPGDAEAAIGAAHSAFPAWSTATAAERARILREWHGLVRANRRTLAELMTRECGKPLTESIGEVDYGASFILWSAEQARRVNGETIPTDDARRRLLTFRQPIGVVAAITPWNFPLAMITRKVSPAIAAGCTVVLKPAEATPLTALALAALAEQAGLPAGVLNVVPTADARSIGQVLSTDPRVRKITFTGSTSVGAALMAQAAGTIKKVSLELGGNAPFIVFADADLDAAVAGAIASKFRNSGQTCVCANRVLVEAPIAERFTSELIDAVRALRVGPGLDEGVSVGPLIDTKGLEKVERLVADARANGARVRCGGERHPAGPLFYAPTVLSGVTSNMACTREEIFGPVVPVMTFADEAEAIRLANDTPFGLAAYFYTRDLGRSWRVAEALEYGMIGLNTGLISTAVAPFGGVKQSGIGREGSVHALDEFTELKYLAIAGIQH